MVFAMRASAQAPAGSHARETSSFQPRGRATLRCVASEVDGGGAERRTSASSR
jgi:hypothetical protein